MINFKICEYCGFEFGLHNCGPKYYEQHLKSCLKNPKNNYTEKPQFFDETKNYLKKQKIKYFCSICNKERICYFKNFKISYLKKCVYCQNKENSDKTKIEKYGSLENWNKQHRLNFEKKLIEKYGSLKAGYAYAQSQKEKAVLKKYNVKNVSYLKKVNDKRKETLNQEEKKQQIRNSLKKTCREKYGVDWFRQSEKFKESYKKAMLQKYGVDNSFKAEEVIKDIKEKRKQTFLKKYGVEHFSQSNSFGKYHKSKLFFENTYFDSKPELAFYIWCKDHNLNIKRCTKRFIYFFGERKHYYFPDFEINGDFFEIKGPQFVNKKGLWQNPFDNTLDALSEAKHQCAIQNNVKILYKENYEKYLDYVYKKYGKNYLDTFKHGVATV